ncbi:energy-coupling factor transport system ATP-binding protein [Bacilli bacterium PM5-3]|nr:energy-coupling factor transport system ATP-binding protein [Bacilli bacterium PM5-3]MDH6603458.1 energy-coupling factor transport system ATP-binding protein [Bacilli bacterium PM5-9]
MSIEIKNLKHIYGKNTVFEYQALNGIDLSISDSSFVAIIGKTGSGKSSLIQHLNAILLPDEGEVKVNDFVMSNADQKTSYKQLRKQVGLVFQFSEYQLFEETVLKDVMFGPLNFDVSEEEAKELAIKYLKMVNLDESIYEKSPFELSGGQKRRVAIAGILAMDPSIIVLDEPTAGLDPQGAIEVMEIFLELKNKYHKTLILVSHDMDFVYEYADEVILLNKGQVVAREDKVTFFNQDYLSKYSIEKPKIIDAYERFTTKKADEFITFDKLINEIEGEIRNVK